MSFGAAVGANSRFADVYFHSCSFSGFFPSESELVELEAGVLIVAIVATISTIWHSSWWLRVIGFGVDAAVIHIASCPVHPSMHGVVLVAYNGYFVVVAINRCCHLLRALW